MGRRSRVGAAACMLLCVTALAACTRASQTDFDAADLTRLGFARDASVARQFEGRMIVVSGYVDHANLYGDRGDRAILGDWWSGESRQPGTWRFNVKARPQDEAGQSFAVYVRSDADRHRLLSAIVADARRGRETPIRVTGTFHTFPAPAGIVARTGVYLEANSSDAIRLGREPGP